MKEELNRELKHLQKQYHDLNEQMILGTIDTIEFHCKIHLNEEQQRAIYKQLEEIESKMKDNQITHNNYNITLYHKIN